MSERSSNLQDLAERLAALREEGAELLARRPAPGTSDHARLSSIDAQIEALSRQLQQAAGQP